MDDVEEYLKDRYYDPSFPGSYSALNTFHREIKNEGIHTITKARVMKFLKTQDAYTMHKRLKRKFKRNKYNVINIDDVWLSDLKDFSSISSHNSDHKYVLVVMDMFSRFVWIFPLKTKKPIEVSQKLKQLFKIRKPKLFVTHKGSEYEGEVQKLLDTEDITHVRGQNETKIAPVERVISTLITRLYRYFTTKQTNTWFNGPLDKIVDSYNHAYHSSIRTAPKNVRPDTRDEVYASQFIVPILENIGKKPVKIKKSKTRKRRFLYKVGQPVRVSYLKRTFEKTGHFKFSGEIFKINKRFRRDNIHIYKLVDWDNDSIKGTFYESELQKVSVDPNKSFQIESILKTRKRRGVKEYFVKWMYYPKKFNSWVSDIGDYQAS